MAYSLQTCTELQTYEHGYYVPHEFSINDTQDNRSLVQYETFLPPQ